VCFLVADGGERKCQASSRPALGALRAVAPGRTAQPAPCFRSFVVASGRALDLAPEWVAQHVRNHHADFASVGDDPVAFAEDGRKRIHDGPGLLAVAEE